ncbi:hypothetical protein AAA799E16_00913 [Marine Group I thaumarchaeote SCGC AAA799-E16]|nr:hypothetical protein AAA799E16_00913 [Marine Group I thaumarchaeote SCGC AAA799-E16]
MNELAANAGPVIPKVIIEIANNVNAKILAGFIFILIHELSVFMYSMKEKLTRLYPNYTFFD